MSKMRSRKNYINVGQFNPNTIADTLWECPKCGNKSANARLESNSHVCPKCDFHPAISPEVRLSQVFDNNEYKILNFISRTEISNPLDFPDYDSKITNLREKTGHSDALVCAVGRIGGNSCAIAVMNSAFLMGSMGVALGEEFTCLVEYAQKHKLPLIAFTASGGARMQEGIFSLMQMAKTSAAITRFSESGGLFIVVFTHPTTGGVSASFASLGDISISEPRALIGFAGPRVIEQTIAEKLPAGFQSAEFQLEHGFLDGIVHRREIKNYLSRVLKLHQKNSDANTPTIAKASEHAQPNAICDAAENKATRALNVETSHLAKSQTLSHECEVLKANTSQDNAQQDEASPVKSSLLTSNSQASSTDEKSGGKKKKKDKTPSASVRVKMARHPKRPDLPVFISALFSDFVEQCGDRSFANDTAICTGIANFEGIPVTVIGNTKGDTLQDKIKSNFGMPSPEGYRKACRAMDQAQKFGRPVITLINTAGAYPGKGAEERGQGDAIAKSIAKMSTLSVPVIAIFYGEGGSGGALALGVANRVIMLENSVYSILSPEGFATILWKDSSRSSQAAQLMGLTAADLLKAGIADVVLEEPNGGAHKDAQACTAALKECIASELCELMQIDGATLRDLRFEKFRNIGSHLQIDSNIN